MKTGKTFLSLTIRYSILIWLVWNIDIQVRSIYLTILCAFFIISHEIQRFKNSENSKVLDRQQDLCLKMQAAVLKMTVVIEKIQMANDMQAYIKEQFKSKKEG